MGVYNVVIDFEQNFVRANNITEAEQIAVSLYAEEKKIDPSLIKSVKAYYCGNLRN